MKHLQLVLEADLDHNAANGSEIKVTPIDLALPENAAVAMQLGIAIADQSDAIPGDGKLEGKGKLQFKQKINLVFVTPTVTINQDFTATIQLVDK